MVLSHDKTTMLTKLLGIFKVQQFTRKIENASTVFEILLKTLSMINIAKQRKLNVTWLLDALLQVLIVKNNS